MTPRQGCAAAATREAGGWHGGKYYTAGATREAGGWHGGKYYTAGATREAGGWHGGKEWPRLRRQAAPVTGPAGRGASQ